MTSNGNPWLKSGGFRDYSLSRAVEVYPVFREFFGFHGCYATIMNVMKEEMRIPAFTQQLAGNSLKIKEF